MKQYTQIPDGLDAKGLRPYAEQMLADAQAGEVNVQEMLKCLYRLSLAYAEAYESPEPDLEDQISRYLLDHSCYDDPQIMELIFASALIFPLPQVREYITGEAHEIRNAEVLYHMKRFWNEE